MDFVPVAQEINLDQISGTTQKVELHNGDSVQLSKLSNDYDPTSRVSAVKTLLSHKSEGKLLTGLIYVDPDSENFHEILNVPKTPLNSLTQNDLCPGSNTLAGINEGLR